MDRKLNAVENNSYPSENKYSNRSTSSGRRVKSRSNSTFFLSAVGDDDDDDEGVGAGSGWDAAKASNSEALDPLVHSHSHSPRQIQQSPHRSPPRIPPGPTTYQDSRRRMDASADVWTDEQPTGQTSSPKERKSHTEKLSSPSPAPHSSSSPADSSTGTAKTSSKSKTWKMLKSVVGLGKKKKSKAQGSECSGSDADSVASMGSNISHGSYASNASGDGVTKTKDKSGGRGSGDVSDSSLSSWGSRIASFFGRKNRRGSATDSVSGGSRDLHLSHGSPDSDSDSLSEAAGGDRDNKLKEISGAGPNLATVGQYGKGVGIAMRRSSEKTNRKHSTSRSALTLDHSLTFDGNADVCANELTYNNDNDNDNENTKVNSSSYTRRASTLEKGTEAADVNSRRPRFPQRPILSPDSNETRSGSNKESYRGEEDRGEERNRDDYRESYKNNRSLRSSVSSSGSGSGSACAGISASRLIQGFGAVVRGEQGGPKSSEGLGLGFELKLCLEATSSDQAAISNALSLSSSAVSAGSSQQPQPLLPPGQNIHRRKNRKSLGSLTGALTGVRDWNDDEADDEYDGEDEWFRDEAGGAVPDLRYMLAVVVPVPVRLLSHAEGCTIFCSTLII